MADDVSGQEAFAAALSGAPEPVVETGTVDAGGQDPGQVGLPEAGFSGGDAGGDGQGQQPQPIADGGQPSGQRQSREEAMVPSWRLREIQEQREADRQAAAKYQREAEQYRVAWEQHQAEQERQRQAAALQQEDFYSSSDPNQFIDKRLDHRLQQIVEPIQQTFQRMQAQLAQETQERSRYFAEQQHGRDKVEQAFQRTMRALQAGDPNAQALDARIKTSRDPWGDIIAFDRRQSLYETTGGDLEGYTKRQLDEALKNPEFLQRALEAARAQATPVQTGVPGRGQPASQPRGGSMPSLNRATGGANDAGESDDPQAVFREALSAVRR